MPPHETSIESHLGGGAIMKRKLPALRNIGIGRNQRALERFQCDYPVERVHGCAHRFLSDFDYRGRELVYCDPPYLHATRNGKRRYRFEYEARDHLELLQLLKTLPCPVMLSGYPSSLYEQELAGWRSLSLQVMNQGGVRTGQVGFNSPPIACMGRATPGRITPTGNASSAKPRAGPGAIVACRRGSAWRCSRG